MFNFSSQAEDPSNRGIVLNADYIHLKAVVIEEAGDNGMLLSGHHNIIEDCVFRKNRDSGLQLSRFNTDTGPIGIVTLENCIAHNNGTLTDGVTSGGGDKNGFKLGSSDILVPHKVIRCIAFNNGKHGFTDNWPFTAGADNFVSLSPGPNNDPLQGGFLALSPQSPLLDAGDVSDGLLFSEVRGAGYYILQYSRGNTSSFAKVYR